MAKILPSIFGADILRLKDEIHFLKRNKPKYCTLI